MRMLVCPTSPNTCFGLRPHTNDEVMNVRRHAFWASPSRGETRAPSQFRNYAQQVEDLLREYQQYAKGNILIKKFDPQPDTEAEDSAQSDGIQPRPLAGGTVVASRPPVDQGRDMSHVA